MKRCRADRIRAGTAPAAFGRLCVETVAAKALLIRQWSQPPSGGCVLKHVPRYSAVFSFCPAAFGRLCVETLGRHQALVGSVPAAFGRLCVETQANEWLPILARPAAFGRLCVETGKNQYQFGTVCPAAFGRLCVETPMPPTCACRCLTSRLRAAVC